MVRRFLTKVCIGICLYAHCFWTLSPRCRPALWCTRAFFDDQRHAHFVACLHCNALFPWRQPMLASSPTSATQSAFPVHCHRLTSSLGRLSTSLLFQCVLVVRRHPWSPCVDVLFTMYCHALSDAVPLSSSFDPRNLRCAHYAIVLCLLPSSLRYMVEVQNVAAVLIACIVHRYLLSVMSRSRAGNIGRPAFRCCC